MENELNLQVQRQEVSLLHYPNPPWQAVHLAPTKSQTVLRNNM